MFCAALTRHMAFMLTCVSVCMIAACAETRVVPYEKLAQAQQAAGCRDDVVDVLTYSAMKGAPVWTVASTNGPIIPATPGLVSVPSGEGGAFYSPRNAKSRTDGQACEATTSGARTKAAHASVERLLAIPLAS